VGQVWESGYVVKVLFGCGVLAKATLSLNQGKSLVLRERAAVVWGIIGILFMGFFAKVRITSFSTVDGWPNMNLSGWG
jgi:hypothetical protein